MGNGVFLRGSPGDSVGSCHIAFENICTAFTEILVNLLKLSYQSRGICPLISCYKFETVSIIFYESIFTDLRSQKRVLFLFFLLILNYFLQAFCKVIIIGGVVFPYNKVSPVSFPYSKSFIGFKYQSV